MARKAQSARPTKFVWAKDTTFIRRYQIQITRGQPWHADHPIVADFPDSFSDEPIDVQPRNWTPPVEQATAAPGELRDATRVD